MVLIFFGIAQCLLFFADICVTSYIAFPFFACSLAGCITGCFLSSSYLQCLLLATPTLFHGLLLYGVTGSTTALCLLGLLGARLALTPIQHHAEAILAIVALYIVWVLGRIWILPYQRSLLPCTIIICIGILSLTYFSLKWLIAVKRGNRL